MANKSHELYFTKKSFSVQEQQNYKIFASYLQEMVGNGTCVALRFVQIKIVLSYDSLYEASSLFVQINVELCKRNDS